MVGAGHAWAETTDATYVLWCADLNPFRPWSLCNPGASAQSLLTPPQIHPWAQDGKKAGAPRTKKAKAAAERERALSYVLPPLPPTGRWEALAETVEEMEEVGLKLKRSIKKQDAALAAKVRYCKGC